MRVIRDLLLDAARAFHYVALEVEDWIIPFCWAADFFWWLTYLFQDIAFEWMDFEDWVTDTYVRMDTFLSYFDLDAWFAYWRGLILGAWDWVTSAWYNVTNIIEDWWLYIAPTVRGWIDSAKQELLAMANSLSAEVTELWELVDSFLAQLPSLNEILGWFTNWWGNILTPLTSWWNERLLEVNTLINDTVKAWFPFYDDLVELWNGILEFFVDPFGWIEANVIDWFLGKE